MHMCLYLYVSINQSQTCLNAYEREEGKKKDVSKFPSCSVGGLALFLQTPVWFSPSFSPRWLHFC